MSGTETTASRTPAERRMSVVAGVCMMTGLACSLIHFLVQDAWSFALFGVAGFPAIGAGMLLYGVVVVRELRERKVL